MTLLPAHVDKAKATYIVPKNITRLEHQCFKDCINLTSITLHNKINYIGDSCFQNCPKLKEIIIPDSVNYLGHSCFRDCINLTNVKLGNGFDVLHKSTFLNCKLLTKVIIPNSVKKHDENGEIFNGCYNLQTIILSDNCNNINSLFPGQRKNDKSDKGVPYKMHGYTCTIYGNFSTTNLDMTFTSCVSGYSSPVYILCNIILKPKSELNTILTDRITANENYTKSLQEELEHVKKIKSTLMSKLNLLECSQGYIGSRLDSIQSNSELSVNKLNKDLDLSFKELNSKVLLLETKDIKSDSKINELEFNNTELINQMKTLNLKVNNLEIETEKKLNDKLIELETENTELTKSIKILESCYILIFILIGVIVGTLLTK